MPPSNIVVWDKQLSDLKEAGFSDLSKKYGIRLAGSAQVNQLAYNYSPPSAAGNATISGYAFADYNRNQTVPDDQKVLTPYHLGEVSNSLLLKLGMRPMFNRDVTTVDRTGPQRLVRPGVRLGEPVVELQLKIEVVREPPPRLEVCLRHHPGGSNLNRRRGSVSHQRRHTVRGSKE